MIDLQNLPHSETAPVRLEFDPDSVAVIDGRTVACSLPVWLRVSPVDAFPRGRWVRMRYRSSFFDDSIRPMIRLETSDGRTIVEPMNGPIFGSGEWIGYVPAGTMTISVNPVGQPGPFSFVIDSVEALHSWHVLYRSVAFETGRLVAGLRERVFNAPDVVDRGLKLIGTMRPISDYHDWHLRLARRIDLEGIDRPRADWRSTPAFILLFRLAGARIDAVEASILSLRGQVYSRWAAGAVVDGADSALLRAYRNIAARDDRCFETASEAPLTTLPHAGDNAYLSLLDAGDTLPETSLAIVAETLARAGDIALLYGDEDARGSDGTLHSPRLKPNWSPIFRRSASYLGRLACARLSDLIRLRCPSVDQFLTEETATLGRLVDALGPEQIHHVRRVLYRRSGEISAPPCPATVVTSPETRAADDNWPEVTIVVPTRDLAELLSQCTDGLKRNTDYPHFRVVVMDNGSRDADALALLDDLRRTPRFTVIDRPGPFNFSALSNEGARVTKSPLLVFLNNDIEMIDDQWLKALIPWALRPEIGVVGAKLLFPRGTIQHAGVVVGLGGIAGHLYRKHSRHAPGYLNALTVPHEVTAVTAACIAIERSKFDAVGGFDEDNLPVELNDIDLCLRVAERGWSTLWTPGSVLCHHESASRDIGTDPSKTYRKERLYFARRWQHIIRDDPHFHPGLSLFAFEPALG